MCVCHFAEYEVVFGWCLLNNCTNKHPLLLPWCSSSCCFLLLVVSACTSIFYIMLMCLFVMSSSCSLGNDVP